jgi:hypothetical protein
MSSAFWTVKGEWHPQKKLFKLSVNDVWWRMLDLDKVNRHQIDRLDPHEDLDNTDGVSPSGTQLM